MDRPETSRHVHSNRIGIGGPEIARLVVTLLAAMVGSIAGGILWLPMVIVLPFWLSLTLPQLLAGVFGSSIAYLVAGAATAKISYTMALSSISGAICAVANILLFMGLVPGIAAVDDLAPPGGRATLLVEALGIGVVAGVVAVRGGGRRRRSRIAFWIALFLSILAIFLLIYVGSAILPSFWLAPNSA
ncbi:hypothetical protein BH24ACT22_BH24ACT22_15720 [soil metagenome]